MSHRRFTHFKRLPWTCTLLCGLLLSNGAALAGTPMAVQLEISDEAAGPPIAPAIYGQFVEHLGRGVYDGLWVGSTSQVANTRGWRRDLVQALQRLHLPVIRWPGGCFADDYDWRDGIGDPAHRPQRLNHWWGGVETNQVGTHEFMDLAEQLGAEVYLAGNMGSLPPQALSQWMEYMTSDDARSSLVQERQRNGRVKPWQVKYVGVGNESWGCGGNMRAEYQADGAAAATCVPSTRPTCTAATPPFCSRRRSAWPPTTRAATRSRTR
jgi:alpha-L-arabinofuranosidase